VSVSSAELVLAQLVAESLPTLVDWRPSRAYMRARDVEMISCSNQDTADPPPFM